MIDTMASIHRTLVNMVQNVTEAEFPLQVLEKSKKVPVLVDFWAEWCGPCRMLGPVLEKIEQTRNDFILIKIDTDQNQQIAKEYKISGIPAVKLFSNATVIGEFTGALPEHMVLKFLDDNLPDPEIEIIFSEAKSDPVSAAKKALAKNKTGNKWAPLFWDACMKIILVDPNNPDLFTFLEKIPPTGSNHSTQATSLRQYLKNNDELPENILKLLSTDKSSVREESLQKILDDISNSTSSAQEKYKENILLAFALLGQNHPLTNQFRKKLATVLY